MKKNFSILLSGEGQNQVWYEKNPIQNQLIIYGESPNYVSFRLTSPKFDWQKHLNVRDDGSVDGTIISEFINDQYAATGEEESFDAAQDKSLFDKFVSKVKEALGSLGMFVENGVASLKEVIADKITTKKLCLEDVCVTKTELQSLLDGTKTNQSVSQPPAEFDDQALINEENEPDEPLVEEEQITEQDQTVVEEEQIIEEIETEEPVEESGEESGQELMSEEESLEDVD